MKDRGKWNWQNVEYGLLKGKTKKIWLEYNTQACTPHADETQYSFLIWSLLPVFAHFFSFLAAQPARMTSCNKNGGFTSSGSLLTEVWHDVKTTCIVYLITNIIHHCSIDCKKKRILYVQTSCPAVGSRMELLAHGCSCWLWNEESVWPGIHKSLVLFFSNRDFRPLACFLYTYTGMDTKIRSQTTRLQIITTEVHIQAHKDNFSVLLWSDSICGPLLLFKVEQFPASSCSASPQLNVISTTGTRYAALPYPLFQVSCSLPCLYMMQDDVNFRFLCFGLSASNCLENLMFSILYICTLPKHGRQVAVPFLQSHYLYIVLPRFSF